MLVVVCTTPSSVCRWLTGSHIALDSHEVSAFPSFDSPHVAGHLPRHRSFSFPPSLPLIPFPSLPCDHRSESSLHQGCRQLQRSRLPLRFVPITGVLSQTLSAALTPLSGMFSRHYAIEGFFVLNGTILFLFKLSVKRRFGRDGANLGCSSPRIRDILDLSSICLSNQRFFLDLMLLIGISVV